MVTTKAALSELQQKLKSIEKRIFGKKVFVGYDGFVDKIKSAVKEKQSTGTTYFKSIQDFADRISLAAGKSGQIQMDTQRVKLGGNAPILSNTLGKLGIKSFCLGSMGYPEKHEIFLNMSALTETISALDPGLSDAVEFSDGKIIFSELQVFDNYNWDHIKKTVGLGRIQKAISESSLLAFVDWANLPHAGDIWNGVLNEVIKPSERNDFYFLFDLCDPSKKTTTQIHEILELISCFSPYGKVTLGLNENETLKIWCALSGVDLADPKSKEKIPPVMEAGNYLYKKMSIDSLLVHPIDRSIVYKKGEMIELPGRLVTKPKVLTGGGDNLNAGYCLGLLSEFSTPQCMLLGMAASGSYIENGASPSMEDIIQYLGVWAGEVETEYVQTPKDTN